MAEESHLYKNGHTSEPGGVEGGGHEQRAAIVIKKYANRRLYNTDTSTYVTLDDLAEMVRSGSDFVVFDARTGEDLTHAVLTQIIVEQESKGGQQTLLPIGFLRQLIRFYGNNMERLVPSYLEYSLDTLTREQEKYRKQFADTFGGAAIEAMQEQTRKNLELFTRALNMFTPFTSFEQPKTPAGNSSHAAAADPAPTRAQPDELAELKSQLAAIQTQLNKMASEK
jgi:polyhydroxyalkanoate synthesis repressor PhaR